MENNPHNLNPGDLIKADIYSNPNFINGKYRVGQIGIDEDDLSKIKSKYVSILKGLKRKADLADKMIAEAEAEGRDTNNPDIMRELGGKINKEFNKSKSIFHTMFG
jgi:hypothetical protein